MLKLETKRKELRTFYDINIGEVFQITDTRGYYIKTTQKEAFSLYDYSQHLIGDFTQVKVLDATLHINNN